MKNQKLNYPERFKRVDWHQNFRNSNSDVTVKFKCFGVANIRGDPFSSKSLSIWPRIFRVSMTLVYSEPETFSE